MLYKSRVCTLYSLTEIWAFSLDVVTSPSLYHMTTRESFYFINQAAPLASLNGHGANIGPPLSYDRDSPPAIGKCAVNTRISKAFTTAFHWHNNDLYRDCACHTFRSFIVRLI